MVHGDSRNKGEKRVQAFRDHVRNLCHSIPPPPGSLGVSVVFPRRLSPTRHYFPVSSASRASERASAALYTITRGGRTGGRASQTTPDGKSIRNDISGCPVSRRRSISSLSIVSDSRSRDASPGCLGFDDFRNGSRSPSIEERSLVNRSPRGGDPASLGNLKL